MRGRELAQNRSLGKYVDHVTGSIPHHQLLVVNQLDGGTNDNATSLYLLLDDIPYNNAIASCLTA